MVSGPDEAVVGSTYTTFDYSSDSSTDIQSLTASHRIIERVQSPAGSEEDIQPLGKIGHTCPARP